MNMLHWIFVGTFIGIGVTLALVLAPLVIRIFEISIAGAWIPCLFILWPWAIWFAYTTQTHDVLMWAAAVLGPLFLAKGFLILHAILFYAPPPEPSHATHEAHQAGNPWLEP